MNKLINDDCIKWMKENPNFKCNLLLTDIPYAEVNRNDNGLRNLNKENADILIFNLQEFLNLIWDKANTFIIFCGIGQVSFIRNYFNNKQKKHLGTVRHLIWAKTNPSPMNGKHIYLSGLENAIWFKKRGSTFNAYCKSNVFTFPCGRKKLHPTEKNHKLLQELILDNSNENDLVFDPCAGSGAHCYIAKQNNRNYFGIELNTDYFEIAKQRIENE